MEKIIIPLARLREREEKTENFRSKRENLRIIEENKPLSPLWNRILNESEACLKHKLRYF